MKKNKLIVLVLMLSSFSMVSVSRSADKIAGALPEKVKFGEPGWSNVESGGPSSIAKAYQTLRKPKTYVDATKQLMQSVGHAVRVGAGLHDESELNDEKTHEVSYFNSHKPKFALLRNKMSEYEQSMILINDNYRVVTEKLNRLYYQYKKLFIEAKNKEEEMKNLLSVQIFKSQYVVNMKTVLTDMSDFILKIELEREFLLEQQIKFDNILKNKNICDSLTTPNLLQPMFSFLNLKANLLTDNGIMQRDYDNIKNRYQKIVKPFDDSQKSWYKKIF